MVRFKVVKGSHLLLALAVFVLVCVIGFIALQGSNVPSESTSGSIQAETTLEAKAQSAFASSAMKLHIETVPDSPIPSSPTQAKRILIYHTHSHEAYAQNHSNPYEPLEAWRTADTQHSVVRVGEALAEALRAYGYQITHDTTDHEQDSLGDSYVRALETMQGYSESFDLRIDLHRDAWVEGLKPCISAEDGTEYAQLMLLVGRGDDHSEKPPYEENLAFAQRLTNALNARQPDICRNVTVKKGRYNQHTDRRCALIEVGHNLNTLEQALASVPCLAASIDDVLSSLPIN